MDNGVAVSVITLLIVATLRNTFGVTGVALHAAPSQT
jgi:hypothetical protein